MALREIAVSNGAFVMKRLLDSTSVFFAAAGHRRDTGQCRRHRRLLQRQARHPDGEFERGRRLRHAGAHRCAVPRSAPAGQSHRPRAQHGRPRGGIAAANFVYAADKDGSQIGLLQNTTPFEPLLGNKDARFDPAKFDWLGTPSVETGILVVWSSVPVNSLDDVKQRETTVGVAGINSPPGLAARLFNDVFGTKLKIVTGYPGLTEALMAMERGEIDGYPSALYSALQVTKADWLPQGKIKALVSYGPEKLPALAGVPYALDLAANEDDKSLLDVAFAPLALGRPLAMPPGVPADRLAAMRKALADTFADPGLPGRERAARARRRRAARRRHHRRRDPPQLCGAATRARPAATIDHGGALTNA